MSGVSRDKALDDMARELAPLATLVIATRSQPSARRRAGGRGRGLRRRRRGDRDRAVVPTAVERALALAAPEDLVCVVGSLFVVAEAREHILELVAAV